MDGIVELEELVVAKILEEEGDTLHLYRWRPRGSMIELPSIYNWFSSSPMDQPSLAEVRDTVTIRCRIAIAYTTPDDEMEKIEKYADSFREVVDPALWNSVVGQGVEPLNGAATKAWRSGMSPLVEQFNTIPALVIELPIVAQLRRVIRP